MHNILSKIQTELKVPKTRTANIGKARYQYRSAEDILEAIKPLLEKYALSLLLNCEPVLIGERYYFKATATLKGEKGEISAVAYAQEGAGVPSPAQASGASISYARKYALGGLLAIDDEKDEDTQHSAPSAPPQSTKLLSQAQLNDLAHLIEATNTDISKLLAHYGISELAQAPYAQTKEVLLQKLKPAQPKGQANFI